ncbi:MAG TPA: phosphoribosylanthranilate isomerase [Solirubrobacteraceae bacterium]|nr:phosphoribosylanthranilate isomerase [Solirubrobacteraceae bacterium]
MTRVKLCGVTSLDDARLCVEHGAWAIGLIFVPRSPRRAKLADAVEIAAAVRRRVEVVGVFENATLDHVAGVAERAALSIVQLHGDEGPSYCSEVARRTGAKVMKAVRVRSADEVRSLRAFHADLHMLDGAGGEPFEWSLARERRSDVPLVVAGGLTPENVGDAIGATHPFAVDVARGVEASPGVKDPEKVAAFVRAAEGALV